ncbi:MAG: hypothetical protein HQ514_03515 [Rhodospirillales bacterium]|nr:hypothetical protein [Rhodospirillales bacterium]
MTQTPEIRRHPNGSIDTGYYTQIGRQRRSEALYDGGRTITRIASVLARMIERIWFHPTPGYPDDTVAKV